MGSDNELGQPDNKALLFQSTLPVWGATACISIAITPDKLFQSTLPVWGATGCILFRLFFNAFISIHAPRVGSDLTVDDDGLAIRVFQSTLPVWGATNACASLTE